MKTTARSVKKAIGELVDEFEDRFPLAPLVVLLLVTFGLMLGVAAVGGWLNAQSLTFPQGAPSGYDRLWRCHSDLAFTLDAYDRLGPRVPEWDRYCPQQTTPSFSILGR